ncbi:MAG TPA: hypothetical protein VF597_02135 [Candidatus Saccharimonadales bacterium]|jgi:hypothetical protein
MDTFVYSLIGMIVFMIAATISHWGDIALSERIVFSLLPLLGLYMLYRAVKSRGHISAGEERMYIDDIGFGLISLLNGFIIVGLLDLRAPGWVVVIGAVLAVIAGNRYIAAVKRRYTDVR